MIFKDYNVPLGTWLNASHHLVHDMVFCVFPSISNSADLVSKEKGILKSTYSGYDAFGGKFTGGYRSTSDTVSGLYFPLGHVFNYKKIIAHTTIIAIGEMLSADSWGAFLCVPYRETGWTGPYISYQFCRNGTSTQGHFGFSHSGGTQAVAESGNNFFIANEGQKAYGFTKDGPTPKFWKDGYYHSDGSKGGSWSAGTEPLYWLNQREVNIGSTGYNQSHSCMKGSVYCVAMWSRVLAPWEIQSFSNNPTQILANNFIYNPRIGITYTAYSNNNFYMGV